MKTTMERFLAALLLALCSPVFGNPELPELTTAQQVMSLTAAEAGEQLPIRLVATVVDEALPKGRALIVADATTSVYVHSLTNCLERFQRTDLLEIHGVSSPGEFAPCILVTNARKIGQALPPAPKLVSYSELLTGAFDAQSVEVTGVVRRVWHGDETNIWHMRLAMPGGIVPVRLTLPRNVAIQMDAVVRLQAICLYQFNQKRQLLGPVLQVSPGMLLAIEQAAPGDPFTKPIRPVATLLQYSKTHSPDHSVHVRGVVTRARAGSFAWIRDETSGLRIQSLQPEPLRPGDWVDAVGFVKFGSYPPVLEDAVMRKSGLSTLPAPIPLNSITDAFNHEDDLVSIEATLTEVRPAPDGMLLTFEREGQNFNVSMKQPDAARGEASWPVQSILRITGICTVQYDDPSPSLGVRHPQSFSILATSPADLTILQRPPWWNARRITLLLAFATACSLAIAGAVMLLARRRLHEQSLRRTMAEKEFAAILSERNRLAREIHDTLAQGLTATLMHLRLLKKQLVGSSLTVRESLDATEGLIRGSLEEARTSIWNMRSQALENGDLPSALQNILGQMAKGADLKTTFHVSGRPRRLAPVLENNLLRLGQEAITNAVKHAHARHIRVNLDFGERRLLLHVSDDGRGFDAGNSPNVSKSFGLIGMNERAAELKGLLKLNTRPNHGTAVEVEVPLLAP